MIEVLTTFDKLNRGDRVRLLFGTDVYKVAAAVAQPEGRLQSKGPVGGINLSFGGRPISVPKGGLVWQVFPRG